LGFDARQLTPLLVQRLTIAAAEARQGERIKTEKMGKIGQHFLECDPDE
jgi:hypothetical protein